MSPLSNQNGCESRAFLQCQKRYPIVVRSKASDGSIQETETKRVHVYGKQWALQVRCISAATQGPVFRGVPALGNRRAACCLRLAHAATCRFFSQFSQIIFKVVSLCWPPACSPMTTKR